VPTSKQKRFLYDKTEEEAMTSLISAIKGLLWSVLYSKRLVLENGTSDLMEYGETSQQLAMA